MISQQEAKADIARYEARLQDPSGLSAEQIRFYQEAIRRAKLVLSSNKSEQPQNPAPQIKQQLPKEPQQPFSVRKVYAGGFQSTSEPITSSIAQANGSQKHNPTITITWSDGYQLTVDETDATNRFKSTLRDAVALQCVQRNRIEKMWRWSTPWRTVGFYQALTSFFGRQPTLQDIGIQRPTQAQTAVFEAVFQKSTEAEIQIK